MRDFDGVRETGAKHIAFMIDEYLGLVFEATEGAGVHDAVAVALEFAAGVGRRFGEAAAARIGFAGGVGSESVVVSGHESVRLAARWNASSVSRNKFGS